MVSNYAWADPRITKRPLANGLGLRLPKQRITPTIIDILDVYVQQRLEDETFLQTVKRIGLEPFKDRVYANH